MLRARWNNVKYRFRQFTSHYSNALRHIADVLSGLAFVASLACLVLLALYAGFDHGQADARMMHRAFHSIQFIFLTAIFFTWIFCFSQTRRDTRVLKLAADIAMAVTLLPMLFPTTHAEWLGWLNTFLVSHKFLYVAMAVYSVLDVSSVLIRLTGRRTNPSLLLAVSFLIFIAVGSFVLMMPKCTVNGISYIDSLFVSTSAVCICGLTPVEISSTFTPMGQGVLLVMFEIGGLGLITFTSFFAVFFSGRQSVYNQLLIRDFIYSKTMNDLMPRLLYILGFTVAIQAVGAVAIYCTMPDNLGLYGAEKVWVAVFQSVSAFCNVGFSNIAGGMANPVLMHSGAWLYVVMSALVFAGALGFPILVNFKEVLCEYGRRFWAWIMQRRHLRQQRHIYDVNTKIVLLTTGIVFVIGFTSFLLLEDNNALASMSFSDKIVQSLFNAVMPRSGGFVTVNPANFLGVTLLIVVLQMWIGGASQSTAGGIKVNTLGVLFLNVRSIARGTHKVTAFKRRIAYQSVRRANAVAFLSIFTVAIFAALTMAAQPHTALKPLLFEVFSATFNVGSSMGITDTLTPIAKAILCVAMFLGRVGLISLLTGMFAKRYDATDYYPEDNVIIN